MVSLLAELPLEAITASRISERAGIGYATFFRHFADPSTVLAAIANEMIAELLEAMLPQVREGNRVGALRLLTAYVDQRREIARALLLSAGPETQRLVVDTAVARSLALPHVLDTDLPPDLAASTIVAAAFATLGWWLARAPELTSEEIADLLLRIAVVPAVRPACA